MKSLEDVFQPGHELRTADDIRVGDLVRFRRLSEERTELHVIRLTDLDAGPRDLYRVYPGPEGMSFLPVEEPAAEIRTWESVRESGRRAREAGSDWRRFGLPLEVIGVFSPGTPPPPKRRLEDMEMPAEVREQIENTLSAAGKVPHPEEPLRVLVGLRIEPAGQSIEGRLQLLRERLPVGATIEITGLVSASPVSEPPLYAAGAYGAMLDIHLQDGALIGYEDDEVDFLLPMDCRCRVEAEPTAVRHETRDGGALVRPTLRLTQIDSFAETSSPPTTLPRSPSAVAEPQWDGVTKSATLSGRVAAARHRLADAAKSYDWDRVIALLEEQPEAVNSSRPDGASRFAPLHQAAHGGAPAGVAERLLEMGAWRTLRTARGERPVDVARRKGHEHLLEVLEPEYRRSVPADDLQRIQAHFHEVIRGRAMDLIEEHSLRLPELENLLEMIQPKVWFPVPGMYGGFSYWLEGEGAEARLVAVSWSRVVGGSGQRHVIDAEGSGLVEKGFV